MQDFFIKKEYLNEIISIIKKIYPNAIVWAYGSRIERTAHEGSDLDLAVRDFGQEEANLFCLQEALQNSNIPFLIDIFDFENLPKSFQENITKNHIELYNGQGK